jgi:hypothetical protein
LLTSSMVGFRDYPVACHARESGHPVTPVEELNRYARDYWIVRGR